MASNQLQDNLPSNAFQANYDQLVALENVTLEAKKELLEAILKSYTMGNSMEAAVMMMDIAGEVQGDTAAQFGAINEIDSDLGNTNADGENMMSAITSYLEGLIPSGGSNNPNGQAFQILQAIQGDLGQNPPNYSDITKIQIPALQNFIANDTNLNASQKQQINNYLIGMSNSANPQNLGAFSYAMNEVYLNLWQATSAPTAEINQINTVLGDLQSILNDKPSRPSLTQMNTLFSDIGKMSNFKDLGSLENALQANETNLWNYWNNWTIPNAGQFYQTIQNMFNYAAGTTNSSNDPLYVQYEFINNSTGNIGRLQADLANNNWANIPNDIQNLIGDINAGNFPVSPQISSQLLTYLSTMSLDVGSGNYTDAVNQASNFFNTITATCVGTGGTSPSNPNQPDYSQITPKMQEMIDDLNGMAAFINAHPDLFADGSGTTLTNQISTIQDLFGTGWGNPTTMCQAVNTWLQQANGGTSPQQIQTLTAAAQSIDRSTSALSSSSRISLDYKTNQYKQIIGDEESSIQTLLQGIIGFIHNDKNQ